MVIWKWTWLNEKLRRILYLQGRESILQPWMPFPGDDVRGRSGSIGPSWWLWQLLMMDNNFLSLHHPSSFSIKHGPLKNPNKGKIWVIKFMYQPKAEYWIKMWSSYIFDYSCFNFLPLFSFYPLFHMLLVEAELRNWSFCSNIVELMIFFKP